MNKEERQAEKLRRQQNKIANKMLIPAPKKTVQSLKLLNFDPSGTFHFVEDRWIRIYSGRTEVSFLYPLYESTRVRQHE